MSNLKTILTSFKLKDELNPKIWDLPTERTMSGPEGQKEKMKPNVRKRLILISKYFVDSFNVDVKIKDIIITGSLVNYNWSKFSDVDLHIIIDYKQFPIEEKETYKELFGLKKTLFNLKYDIKVKGYDVEVYAQDSEEAHFSTGVYSVKNNKWIEYPKKESDVKIDTFAVQSKSKTWMKMIDSAIEESQDGNLSEGLEILKKCREKLKKFRQSGLEKGGEYSVENLVFKVLRRNGYIEKLFSFQEKLMDKKLSLKESTSLVQGKYKTDLENGPKNHGARAFGNWQSDNAWDMFAPEGTTVNSFTEGKVVAIRDTGKNSGKVYGTQVQVKGENGYPDIFYTHIKNVTLKIEDQVKVGDRVGEISEWLGHDSMTHVHIGLPYGFHISELLNGEKFDSSKFIKELSYDLSKIDTPFKIEYSTYDKRIEKIQQGLELLGYKLQVHGVDGIFGNETKNQIEKFKKDNDVDDLSFFEKISKGLLGNFFNSDEKTEDTDGDIISDEFLDKMIEKLEER